MSRLRALLSTPAENWTLRRLTDGEEPPAGERYLSVHLNAAHLESSRRGTKMFHGLVGTAFELDSLTAGAAGSPAYTGLTGSPGSTADTSTGSSPPMYGCSVPAPTSAATSATSWAYSPGPRPI